MKASKLGRFLVLFIGVAALALTIRTSSAEAVTDGSSGVLSVTNDGSHGSGTAPKKAQDGDKKTGEDDAQGHEHVWSLKAAGAVATVKCTVEECDKEYTATISADGKTYDGTAAAAELTLAQGFPEQEITVGAVSYTGRDGTVYTLSETAPKDTGKYTASVELRNGDADSVTVSVDFEITKATPKITTAPTAGGITYGDKLSNSKLTGGKADTEGSFAWSAGGTKPAVSDSNKTEYDVIFTPTDTKNYNTVSAKVKVKVDKAVLTAAYKNATIACNGTPKHEVTVTGFVNGETAGTAAGYKAPVVAAPLSYEAGTTYKLTPSGAAADNYTFLYKEGKLTVNGHDWGKWKTTKEATVSETGEKTRVCSVDSSHTETKSIPKLKEYTITYDLNGGYLNGKTGLVTETCVEGSVITLPSPTRAYYTFSYWKGSKYYAGDKFTVDGDHTFTAQWTSRSYSSSNNTNTNSAARRTVNSVPTVSRVTGNTSSGTAAARTSAARTGDTRRRILWFVILAAAAAVIVTAAVRRHRRDRDQ